jgi:hypothetical protein
MRINVFIEIDHEESTAALDGKKPGIVKLSIVLERGKTVEALARQIEAEYAFMYMEKTMAKSESQGLIHSLHVIMVYDIGDVPLSFNVPPSVPWQ